MLLSAIPAILLLIYGAGGFLLVPSLIVDSLSDSLRQAVNMGITAGEARFNPFTLRLLLRDVTSDVTSGNIQSGQQPAPEVTPLKIDEISADLNPFSLLRRHLVCNQVNVHGISLSMIRFPDKSYNLPSPAMGPSAGKDGDSARGASLLFSLNNIRISDSRILFDDRLAGKKHSIEQIRVELPTLSNFSHTATETVRPHFSAIINGSPVELSGEAALPGTDNGKDIETNLACDIRNLDLPFYFAYLPESLPLTLNKGAGNGKLQISFIPENKKNGRLTIDFQLAATDVELANRDGSLTMAAPALEIGGSLNPFDGSLRLRNLHIRQPQCSAVPARFSRDLTQIFPGRAEAQRPAPQPHLAIDALTVEEGTLQLLPGVGKSASSPPWTSIGLEVTNFNPTPDPSGQPGTFTLNATQEKTGASFNWQGAFDDRGIPDGRLRLQNFPANILLDFLNLDQGGSTSGIADLSGRFILDPYNDPASAPAAANFRMTTLIDGAIELNGLALAEGQKAWFSAKTMRLKGTGFSKDNLDLGAITIEGGNLTLHQGHLPRLLTRFGESRNPVAIQQLDFSGNATLHAQDEHTPPLVLTELRLKGDALAGKGNTRRNFECSSRIHEKGMLKAEGLATLFPLRAQLSLLLSDINAEQTAPWLPDAPLFQHGRAAINGEGTYRYPESSFTGSLRLDSPLFRGDGKGPGLSANTAVLNNITIKASPLRVGMDELVLDAPLFTWQQTANDPGPVQQMVSFLRSLLASPAANGKQQEGTTPAIPLIKKINFENGRVNYTDQRLTPAWSPAVTQLKGSLSHLHEKAPAGASFDLSGLLASAPFTLSGFADFLTSPGDSSTRFEIHDLALASLTDQITPLLDLKPGSGSVSLSFTRAIPKNDEQGEAHLVFTGITPGSAQSNTALTLALLTDHQNQTKLSVPLSGNNSDPLFNQAITAFKTLMVKAEISPLLLLANTEFAGQKEQQEVLFPPGLSTMETTGTDSDANKTPQWFAGLLAARPHLGLVFTGMADPELDRAAIKRVLEEKEKKRIAQKNEQRMQEWQKKEKQRREMAAKAPQTPAPGKIIEEDLPAQEAPPAPLAPEPVIVTDTMLHDLAQERMLHLYDFCTTNLGIASDRITLREKTVLSAPGEKGNQVRMGLKTIP